MDASRPAATLRIVGLWGLVLAIGLAGCAAATRKPDTGRVAIRLPAPAELVGPGDTLVLRVANAPEWDGRYEVGADGTISLGLGLGAEVAGLTPAEAGQAVERALASELRTPDTTLDHQPSEGVALLILGEVPSPGEIVLSASEPTLANVLARAFPDQGASGHPEDARLVLIRPYGRGRHAVLALGSPTPATLAPDDRSSPRLARYDILVTVPASAGDTLATARRLAEAGLTERFRIVHGAVAP